MTKTVRDVLCPACKSTYTSQLYSEEVDVGVYTAWHAEEWKCNDCGRKFRIGCERKLSYYVYRDEEFEDGEDYELDYNEC